MRQHENLQNSENGLVRAVVEFCSFIRANGVRAGTAETIDCLQALRAVKNPDPDTFKFTLRSVLCSSMEEWMLFGALFVAFWGEDERRQGTRSRKSLGGTSSAHDSRKVLPILCDHGAGSDFEGEDERKDAFRASAVDRLRKVDFSQVPETDMAELERVSLRLLRRMSERVSRRLQPRKSGDFVDLRKTIRGSIGRGGDLIELNYKRHKRERARLVILLDASDSMNLYSFFLLKFAYALGKHSREVASFIFSTNLVAITNVLRTRRLSGALEKLSLTTTGWSGGTRIGGSLQEFNRLYAGKLLSRNTIFIILSDGWDTGTPEVLVDELRKIKLRVSKLIWLNPLLGLEDYEPVTLGMSAALPYVDVFASAHNLESLLKLEKHLRPTMAP